MTLKQLNDVVTIAEEGSMLDAANKLHVTQPNLSKSTKLLENEIGCQLFVRSKRGTRVSEDGKEFLQNAKQIVDMVREMEALYDQ